MTSITSQEHRHLTPQPMEVVSSDPTGHPLLVLPMRTPLLTLITRLSRWSSVITGKFEDRFYLSKNCF